jgi:hypothetical protein
MARGSVARIEDGKGLLITLRDGELWITQERDRRDYVLRPGESFRLDRPGVAVISAMRRSALTVTAPTTAAL